LTSHSPSARRQSPPPNDPATGGPVERYDYIRRCAEGGQPIGASEPIAELISRYAPVAAVMNGFYGKLFGGRPETPYPAQEVMQAHSTAAARALPG
jgi:hypothetical protein